MRIDVERLSAVLPATELVEVLKNEITSLLAAGDRLESQLCEVARERDSLRLALERLGQETRIYVSSNNSPD